VTRFIDNGTKELGRRQVGVRCEMSPLCVEKARVDTARPERLALEDPHEEWDIGANAKNGKVAKRR